MKQYSTLNIQKPRTDEGKLWDILLGKFATLGLLTAYDLKLFPLLAEKKRTLEDICNAINIDRRPAQALLSVLISTELVQFNNGLYSLTKLSEDYLLESSSSYFGGYLDMVIANSQFASFEGLKNAILTNSPQIYGGEKIYKSHQQEEDLARRFTYGMHGHSMGVACVWPEVIDLSAYKMFLDIAGGSGAHAIGAVFKWSNLQATVLDLPHVCKVAEEIIREYNLHNRISTESRDMWSDPFPVADIHFYSNIYHNWTPEKCRALTRKSFESLEPGGRIIIHEMLYNNLKTKPFSVAAQSLIMLLTTEGQQYCAHELSVILKDAGFTDVEFKPTCGYWSIVTGCKPR